MKNKLSFLTFLFLIVVFSGCRKPEAVYPENMSQLHKNIVDDILEDPVHTDSVSKYLAELKADGSWPEIDYTSKERGGWPPRNHISKLLVIVKAYQTRGMPFYNKKVVSEKIHLALNFWLENDFQCPNWWYPEIGVPQVLAPVLILMEAELSAEQFEKGIRILNRSAIGMTGQNKVWQSGNVLLRNLLLKNEDTIRMAATSIQEELVVSTGEGVQPDWSYHQHGPQLQFGNYGLAYVGDMIKWIKILRNTPFQFDETKIEILRNYLLEGQKWVNWKNRYDISACGRQLFPGSQVSKAESLARYLSKMKQLDAENSSYSGIEKDGNMTIEKEWENLTLAKHFWRSDFHVYRSPEYYFSVKMCSKRVIGAESCNAENIQGYYMGDGATFLYQSQEEYNDIFPFWDWKKIPGTTVQQDDSALPVLTASGYRIESDFVGGLVGNIVGKYPAISVAVMQYNREGLTARKAWFMMGDMIVCLGNSISSKSGLPVTTSVNQSFLKGEVVIKSTGSEKVAGETESLQNPQWFIHDSIGYYFPDGGKLHLETREVQGSWHWVASRYPQEILKSRIFKLWLEHGNNPQNETYQYILVPNADKSKMEEMEKNLQVKIRNDKYIQEVISSKGWSRAIIFYKPGKSDALGGFEVSQSCIVIIDEMMGAISIRVADPTQKLEKIQLKLNSDWKVNHAKVDDNGNVIIEFPFGNMADHSHQFTVQKN